MKREYNMRTLLVTGGAGFIGSNFIKYMLESRPKYKIINLDLLTYAGNLENLKDVSENPNYIFIKGDISDRSKVKEIFSAYGIDSVINFAAESHVDRSIENPEVFLTTNVIGTQVLLDAAKKSWNLSPGDKYSREYKEGVRFIQVSTDEVYGSLGKKDLFSETSPLNPNSPYAASKASADMIARAYYKTYGLPINITRCSNNYGPYQFPEKLIPLMIYNCIKNESLPVYGDGLQVRDWLHVKDHCMAIDAVMERGKAGEVYNIGGNNEKTNIEIVKLIIEILGKSDKLIRHVKDRPGHDRRYAIDNTKITSELGWSPEYTFEEGIKETIKWYVVNIQWIENVVSGDYTHYSL
jgi:dTDP-glucose 4,6-dehydratase